MRSGSALLLGLAGAALSNALTVDKRDSPAVLTVPISRESSTQRHLSTKRSKTVDFDVSKERLSHVTYVANMTFGTPHQNFLSYLDSYATECWLLSVDGSDCSRFYHYSPSDCDGYGGYNMTRSTTAKKNEKFSYDDGGTYLTGDYVTDTLSIGGVDVDNMKLGIVTSSAISSNNLGIGYGDRSFPELLTDAGVINTPALSIYRQMALFGGINKAQYNGSLYTFPIVNGSYNGTEHKKAHRINLDGMSINGTSVASDEFSQDAFFSLTAGMTYVPKAIAQALNAQIGITSVPDSYGQVNFSCNAVSDNTTIGFKFGDLDLEFNLFYFVSQERDEQTYGWSTTDDNTTCYFTICENDDDLRYKGNVVLGANFLDLVYAVFDLQNEEISLAELPYGWFNQSAEDIVEITSDGVSGIEKDSDKDSAGMRVVGDLGMTALAVAVAMLVVAF